jgi:hypothetical protein
MPVARRPENGQSAFARNLAVYHEIIGTPRPDGVLMPPPVPKHSVVHRITTRLRLEEQARKRRELLFELYGDPPDVKGGG